MGFVKNTIGAITGSSAADAAEAGRVAQVQATQEAIARQEAGAGRAQEFLQPFGAPGQQGLEQASFLTDPQQQFDFLQSNPLFSLALEQAQTGTQKLAAARGRLSAGDTLEQLSKNVLLSASPLIGDQKRSIAGLLDFGRGVAGQQANVEIGATSNISPLLQDVGNINAAGGIGVANARAAGTSNLINLATLGASGGFGGGGGAVTTGLTPTRFISPGAPGSVGQGGGAGL
jgi:hypothetical protein